MNDTIQFIKFCGLLTLACSSLILITLTKPITNYIDTLYIDVNHIGIVTDKWIKHDTSFWIFGNKDYYVLEINNDHTEEVSDNVYYNTDIGDYRNWTTKELKED
jgi:hypothetical protein